MRLNKRLKKLRNRKKREAKQARMQAKEQDEPMPDEMPDDDYSDDDFSDDEPSQSDIDQAIKDGKIKTNDDGTPDFQSFMSFVNGNDKKRKEPDEPARPPKVTLTKLPHDLKAKFDKLTDKGKNLKALTADEFNALAQIAQSNSTLSMIKDEFKDDPEDRDDFSPTGGMTSMVGQYISNRDLRNSYRDIANLHNLAVENLKEQLEQSEKNGTFGVPDAYIDPINDKKEILLHLGKEKDLFYHCLDVYIKSFYKLPSKYRDLSPTVAKMLFSKRKTITVIHLRGLLSSGLSGAFTTISTRLSDDDKLKLHHLMLPIFSADDILASANLGRDDFLKGLANDFKLQLKLDRKGVIPGAETDGIACMKIYNRFHKDQFNVNDRYIVEEDGVSMFENKHVIFPSYTIYDRHGKSHRVALTEAVDNVLWQMDKATAEKVAKSVHDKLEQQKRKQNNDNLVTDVEPVKVDDNLRTEAEADEIKPND